MTQNQGSDEKTSAAAVVSKLVLLPAMLALGLLLIALSFAWLTAPEGNVDRLVAALSQEGKTRWRAAAQLATLMRDPAKAAMRSDPVLARRLSAVLHEEIDTASMQRESLMLRVYLCRALGEFTIPDPLPVLMEAAGTERNEQEIEVRCAAIEGLAVLASNVGAEDLRDQEQLIDTLLAASTDRHAALRSSAAFTLGVTGGSPAEGRLEELLCDQAVEVRYNAATGLARHGNTACVETLLEMLDPKQTADDEAHGSWVQSNALKAADRLVEANEAADLRVLESAVKRLTRDDVPTRVRVEAVGVVKKFRPAEAGR